MNKAFCILEPDSSAYSDDQWLISKIRKIPALPDAFICANDYLALQMMTALKRHGIAIPQDVMIAGFDGTCKR